MLGTARLALEPEFSGDSKVVTPVTTSTPPGAAIQQWTLRSATLRGQMLRIRGLKGSMTDALVRVEFADGTTWVQRLTGDEPSASIPMRQSGWSVAGVYLKLGVEHILTGVDHLLFVLALLLITGGGWKLVKDGHRIHYRPQHYTRGGDAGLRASMVETGRGRHRVEHRVCRSGDCSSTKRARGCYGARSVDCGVYIRLAARLRFRGRVERNRFAAGNIPLALLFFNVGVELGQLLFIAAVLAFIVPTRSPAAAALGGDGTSLRHRHCGHVLGYSTHRGVLKNRTAARGRRMFGATHLQSAGSSYRAESGERHIQLSGMVRLSA